MSDHSDERRAADGDVPFPFKGDPVVQVGWMDPTTGVMCDCPVYEVSPHANSVPVYREVSK